MQSVQTSQASTQLEQIREFVIAGHGNLQKVKNMLNANPGLLNAQYRWNENDTETAIQAAAQVGSASVARYLLERGAPLEICTAAMLGLHDEVVRFLNMNPGNVKAVGAHGIPLLPHTVWSGNLGLVQLVYQKGATSGEDLAFHNAVVKGDPAIVEWLLNNTGANIASKNYQGKTALTVATERGNYTVVDVLKAHGAVN
jgi:uncharacterized protein